MLVLSWDGWSTLGRDSPQENVLSDSISGSLLKLLLFFFSLKRDFPTHDHSPAINSYSSQDLALKSPPLGQPY